MTGRYVVTEDRTTGRKVRVDLATDTVEILGPIEEEPAEKEAVRRLIAESKKLIEELSRILGPPEWLKPGTYRLRWHDSNRKLTVGRWNSDKGEWETETPKIDFKKDGLSVGKWNAEKGEWEL